MATSRSVASTRTVVSIGGAASTVHVGSTRFVGSATAADTRAPRAQDAEQFEELVALGRVESPEDLVGTVTAGRLETVEQVAAAVAQCHQDRSPVTGIGVAGDQPGRLEGVHNGRHRPGDHVQLGGQIGHTQGVAAGRHQSQHPRLGIGEPQGGELRARAPPQAAGGMGEQLGEFECGLGAPPGR